MSESNERTGKPSAPAPPAVESTALTSARRASIPPAPGEGELWGNRTQVLEEVGRGAMARVLRGFDTKLRREMAIKVALVPRREMPRDLLARFAAEAQITAQLEHPNIVPVHSLGLDPAGRVFFSMKLVRGRSLDTIIELCLAGDTETVNEFGLRRLLDIFLQVCQAIEYAHARGVIHRDVKPANVMVGDFGEVAVTDWGVAKLLERAEPGAGRAVSTAADELGGETDGDSMTPASLPTVTSVRAQTKAWDTQTGTVLGTPQYMSPEQAKGLAVDQRSDIYSLGVILYEILHGQVPFDDDDPKVVLARLVSEAPRRPSETRAAVPPALEALAMRLLVKDPDERTLSIAEIRQHIQDYIEGIGHDYRREPVWGTVAWTGGALLLFAFLVWYLTGQSIANVVRLGPPAVLNAVGWFFLVVAVGYPLWAQRWALRLSRRELDPFRKPNSEELFVSGYLAHRSFAAALAPLFQLVFIVELTILAVIQASRGGARSELMQQFSAQMRAEWSEALIVILVFQFAYLFLLCSEVRFARRIDRFELLVRRQSWESVWPVFLIIVLLATVTTTDVLGRTTLQWRELLTVPERPVEILKTLVFQGTFLLALTATTMLAAFSFSELLAALRAVSHATDEAAVVSRVQYFLRSMAVFRVLRAVWLYGGAMIGTLTAMRILSEGAEHPLLEKILYILGPSLIGFWGYSALRRRTRSFVAEAPALERLLAERVARARGQQHAANLIELERVPMGWPIAQLAVPVACLAVYVLWTASGLKRDALRELIVPVTTKDWLVILPYVLLVPLLLSRDALQRRMLRRTREGE
jgi:serine/threonine protein kinase